MRKILKLIFLYRGIVIRYSLLFLPIVPYKGPFLGKPKILTHFAEIRVIVSYRGPPLVPQSGPFIVPYNGPPEIYFEPYLHDSISIISNMKSYLRFGLKNQMTTFHLLIAFLELRVKKYKIFVRVTKKFCNLISMFYNQPAEQKNLTQDWMKILFYTISGS